MGFVGGTPEEKVQESVPVQEQLVVETPTTQTAKTNSTEGIVIAEGSCIHFQLLGAVSNGNAVIPLSHGKAIKFTRGKEFTTKNKKRMFTVTMQILDAGIGKEIIHQSWNRTKKVIQKKTIIKEVKTKPKTKKVEVKIEKAGEVDLLDL